MTDGRSGGRADRDKTDRTDKADGTRSTALTALSALTVLSALWGCGGAAGDRPSAASGRMDTIDSAGVTLAINYGGDRALGKQPVERFTLKTADGAPAEFSGLYPGQVATGTDGHAWVVDREFFRVREFGPDGIELRSLGRKGQGPGEFQIPFGLVARPDGGIWVLDIAKRAFVTFDPGGTPGPEVSFREAGTVVGAAMAQDGLVLQVQRRSGNPVSPLEDLLIARGADTTVLFSFPMNRKPARFESCAVAVAMPQLFSKRLGWSTAGTGIVATREDGYIIDRFSGDSLVSRISRDIPVQLTTTEMAERELGEGMALGIGDRSCRIPPGEVVEKLGMSGSLPVVDNVALAPDGTIWVKRRTFPDEPDLVDVLAPDGRYQGTLTGTELPVAFLPDGAWLAIETDSLDVQHVVARSF